MTRKGRDASGSSAAGSSSAVGSSSAPGAGTAARRDATTPRPKKRRGLLAPDEPLEGESTRVRPERPPYDPAEGRGIVWASWIGTVIFTLTAVLAMISISTAIICVVVSLVLFAVGTVAFVSAFLRAVNRSRYESIGMGGLYFLAGETAPARVQVLLLGSLGVETVVALVAASARMYTGLAFGILVPMFGLGLAGLWGARYGRFSEREPDPVKPTRSARTGSKKTTGPTAGPAPIKKPPRVR